MATADQEFRFDFADRYRLPARLFGVTEHSASVLVTGSELVCRFGPWSLRTPLLNITDVTITGPYSWLKTVGPAHLSFADRGITMATNDVRGVCVTFRESVKGIDALGLIRHPNLTVTVADCAGLVAALSRKSTDHT
jgi:hypothetical protein